MSKKTGEVIIGDEAFTDLIAFTESKASEITTSEKCKLCQSEYKAEAHKEFDRTKNVQSVVNLLHNKGEEISYPAVRNHINNHYKTIQEHQNIYELAKKLQKWGKVESGDEAIYSRYIQMLDMEATTLMAENPNLDPVERRKNVETVLKIAQTIVQFKESIHELKIDKRPVQIFVDSLTRIVAVKLQDCKPEVKQALKEVVDQLFKDVDLANPTVGLKEEE